MKTGLASIALFYFACGWIGIFLYQDMLLGGITGSLLVYGWAIGPSIHLVVEWFERRSRLKARWRCAVPPGRSKSG